jgi:predicted ester cyclase
LTSVLIRDFLLLATQATKLYSNGKHSEDSKPRFARRLPFRYSPVMPTAGWRYTITVISSCRTITKGDIRMSAADHKQTSKNLLELWGDNALHKSDGFLAANYVNHQMPDAAVGTSAKSLQEWKDLVADFHRGFSNVKMEVLLQVAEGNYVCSRWRMTAEHTGTFGDIASTGKTSTWTGTHTDRYEGGKLVESWVDWDKYSFLEGLGLVV